MPIGAGVDIQGLQPDVRANLYQGLAALGQAGINFLVTSANRSPEKQQALWADRAHNPYPVAPPGTSAHESGRAVDITLQDEGQRQAASRILQQHGFNWFGAGDRVHYTYGSAPTPAAHADPGAVFDRAPAATAAPPPDPGAIFDKPAPRMVAKADPGAIFDKPAAAVSHSDPGAIFDQPPGASAPPSDLSYPRHASVTPGAVSAGGPVGDLSYPRHTSAVPGAVSPEIPLTPKALGQTAVGIGKGIGAVVNVAHAGFSVADAFLNQVVKESARPENAEKQGWQAVADAARRTPWAKVFNESITGQSATFPTPLTSFAEGQGNTPLGNQIRALPGGPALYDLVLGFPIEALMGHAQDAVMSRALPAAGSVAERLLSKIPAVQRMLENGQVANAATEVLNRNVAGFSSYLRDADSAVNDLQQTSQKYLKTNPAIRQIDPHSGKVVNKFDELVMDYIEHGTQGAKFQQTFEVEHAAHQLGVNMADVRRVGDNYATTVEKLGQHLVNFGLLDEDKYRALQGQYLPRLYQLTTGNPGDVGEFLKFMQGQGVVSDEVLRAANQMGKTNPFSRSGMGLQTFNKGRTIEDFALRNDPTALRAAVPEATPAFSRYVTSASRAAGEAAGHAEIAANPEWALPLNGGQRIPTNFVDYHGTGPLAGHAIHSAIASMLETRGQPNATYTFARNAFGKPLADAWQTGVGTIRKLWLGSPKTIQNIVLGHFNLAAAAAKMHGAEFNLSDYTRAMHELRQAAKGGKASPYLDEALNRTSIFNQGSSIVPKAARQVSRGFGVETRAQNLVAKVKKPFQAYGNLTHDLLAGGKLGLYTKLRQAGHSIEDAARITRQATIDYASVPNWVRQLDQGNFLPFLSFPVKAVPQYAQMALRRPDLFATGSGLRFQYYLDRIADAMATQRGQKPEAVARRQSGAAGPIDFPIPGQRQPGGAQAYAHVPQFAPILHHFVGGQTTDIAGPALEQVKNFNPIVSLAQNLVTNQNTRGAQVRPIVEPNSQPPGPEAAQEFAKFGARNLLPAFGDAERIINAFHGTTTYPSPNTPVQTVKSALLQALTGIKYIPGVGITKEEQQQQAAKRMNLDPKMVSFVQDYGQYIFQRFNEDPNYRPNARYAEAAHALSPDDLARAGDASARRMTEVMMGHQFEGEDKLAAVRRATDWVATIGFEQYSRALAAGTLTR